MGKNLLRVYSISWFRLIFEIFGNLRIGHWVINWHFQNCNLQYFPVWPSSQPYLKLKNTWWISFVYIFMEPEACRRGVSTTLIKLRGLEWVYCTPPKTAKGVSKFPSAQKPVHAKVCIYIAYIIKVNITDKLSTIDNLLISYIFFDIF